MCYSFHRKLNWISSLLFLLAIIFGVLSMYFTINSFPLMSLIGECLAHMLAVLWVLFDSKGNLIGIVNSKHTGAESVGYVIKTSFLSNLV